MIQLPISDWRKCPPDAQVRVLVLGECQINVDSSLEALVEFCGRAAVKYGAAMGRVMRSKKFNDWLGYDSSCFQNSVKCGFAVFVASSDSVSVNLMRIYSLTKELGISLRCSLLYEEAHNDDQEKAIVRRALFKIGDEEVPAIRPQFLTIGLSRIPVSSWNECLPRYINYIKTSVPLGCGVASKLTLPAEYKFYKSFECVQILKSIVKDSCLDRYSVYIEYDTAKVGLNDDAVGTHEVESKPDGGREDGDSAPVVAVVASKKFRHFIPDVSLR